MNDTKCSLHIFISRSAQFSAAAKYKDEMRDDLKTKMLSGDLIFNTVDQD